MSRNVETGASRFSFLDMVGGFTFLGGFMMAEMQGSALSPSRRYNLTHQKEDACPIRGLHILFEDRLLIEVNSARDMKDVLELLAQRSVQQCTS